MLKFDYEQGNECIISNGKRVYMDRSSVSAYESIYNRLSVKPETLEELEDAM